MILANLEGGEQLVYTQAPPLTRKEIESLLKEAKYARFCSLNPDGTIHAAPVWYKYERGRIIIETPAASRKARNATRNRNVTILIDIKEGEAPAKGAIVYGKAEMKARTEEMQSEALSLYEKYMPRDVAERFARGMFKLTKWVIISVKPEHIASFDYAQDKGEAEVYRAAIRG